MNLGKMMADTLISACPGLVVNIKAMLDEGKDPAKISVLLGNNSAGGVINVANIFVMATEIKAHGLPSEEDARLVTVCDQCWQACCFQGEFYCDEYRAAGTHQVRVSDLRKLNLESSDYWT